MTLRWPTRRSVRRVHGVAINWVKRAGLRLQPTEDDQSTNEELAKLMFDLQHRGVERRRNAVSQLRDVKPSDAARRALVSALRDPNELVRVEAAQSLSTIGNRQVLAALWRALGDSSPLVRSYAAAAIGVLGRRGDAVRLHRLVEGEPSDVAKLGFYTGLHSLGHREALRDIVNLLSSRTYQVRCASANTLAQIADSANADVILKALRLAIRRESTVAARGDLRKAIEVVRHLPAKRRSV